MLLRLQSYCSASAIFTEARIDCISALQGKKITSLIYKISSNSIIILIMIAEEMKGPLMKHLVNFIWPNLEIIHNQSLLLFRYEFLLSEINIYYYFYLFYVYLFLLFKFITVYHDRARQSCVSPNNTTLFKRRGYFYVKVTKYGWVLLSAPFW